MQFTPKFTIMSPQHLLKDPSRFHDNSSMTGHIKPHFGKLFIVPTPIGNLEDITLRALRVLKEVEIICAEDTRHTKKLLNHFGITTPLTSYYREKEAEKSGQLIEALKQGKDIALVSDAGTPAISDPGAILVGKSHLEGIKVIPLPGASAVTTALSASGLPHDGFLFLGFPPVKKGQREKFLNSILNNSYPVVLYESPKRISAFLADAIRILGNRDGFWARELTKTFEELVPGTLSEFLEKCTTPPRGEFVLIICPGQKEAITGESLEDMLVWYRDNSNLSVKDVSKKLSDDLGLSKSQVYKKAIAIWHQKAS